METGEEDLESKSEGLEVEKERENQTEENLGGKLGCRNSL